MYSGYPFVLQRDRATPSRAEWPVSRRRRPCGLLLQTHSSGVVSPSMRSIATDAQQWRGRSIHAAYCYRRATVAWSVHTCGLLLQTSSSGVVGPYMRPITIAPMGREQPGGQRIQALPCISSFFIRAYVTVLWCDCRGLGRVVVILM